MATQTVEYAAPSGLTLTTKLFPVGIDTETDSVVATENTSRLGWYNAVYTDVPAATYLLVGIAANGKPVAIWDVTLTLTTATFQAGVGVSVVGGDATEAKQDTIISAIANVNPVQSNSISRTSGNTLTAYVGENITFPPVTTTDVDGSALDCSSITCEAIIELTGKTDVLVIADGDLTKTSTTITFASTTAPNTSEAHKNWSIRRTDTNVVVAHGPYVVEYRANKDT